jgi:hypothetical protein
MERNAAVIISSPTGIFYSNWIRKLVNRSTRYVENQCDYLEE